MAAVEVRLAYFLILPDLPLPEDPSSPEVFFVRAHQVLSLLCGLLRFALPNALFSLPQACIPVSKLALHSDFSISLPPSHSGL